MQEIIIDGDTLSAAFMVLSTYVLINYLRVNGVNVCTVGYVVLESIRRIIAFLRQME